MFHNKTSFEAMLTEQFRISEKWRNGNYKRYADHRNADASQRLREIRSQISINDTAWEELQPLVSGPICLAAISETNRDVGFRTHPHNFPAWFENFHCNLTRDRGAE